MGELDSPSRLFVVFCRLSAVIGIDPVQRAGQLNEKVASKGEKLRRHLAAHFRLSSLAVLSLVDLNGLFNRPKTRF